MSNTERVRKIVESLPDPIHSLDECATALLDWVASLDPSWADRIKIMRDERGFEPRYLAASLMAYPLDHSLHMELTTNPIIAQATGDRKPGDPIKCEMCGTEFKPPYAGCRPLCSNRCANGYDAKERQLQNDAAAVNG